MSRWFLALLSLVPIASAQAVEVSDGKLNVLFIVSDDLTNNALSCYGADLCKTFYIDKLAERGVKFERAYCQFPLCNPSRASFLTGLRPDTTRVYENATQFRKNVPAAQSMPQTFRNAGYTVRRVGKLYHYGVPAQIGTDGLDDPDSWEKTINPKGRDKDDEDKIFSLLPTNKGPARFGGVLSWLAAEGKDEDQTDGKIADTVIEQMKELKDKRFFLACGFFRPHTPYVAPKKYFDLYPLEKIKLAQVPEKHRDSAPAPAFGSHKKEQEKLDDDLRRKAIQAYLAATTFMDAQVGRVLTALADLKLDDTTIVVFISDHGYHLGEHGLWQKMSLFENSARVPLIISDPRNKVKGQETKGLAELIDLHPTLAELNHIDIPKGLDGKSLVPLLNKPNTTWDKPAFTQVSRGTPTMTGDKLPAKKEWFMGYSVRTPRYRYTEWDGGAKGTQLYDYEKDPQELTNLANEPTSSDVVKKMKELLAGVMNK
jgi:iduronate 2-sulfatase